MSNTDILQSYTQQLGSKKIKELWKLYKSDTRNGLYNKVSRWVLQSEAELLKNFFHSRQAGAQTFGMDEFSTLCRQMEDHLTAGGGLEIINSHLKGLSKMFEEEAKKVENTLKKDV